LDKKLLSGGVARPGIDGRILQGAWAGVPAHGLPFVSLRGVSRASRRAPGLLIDQGLGAVRRR